ncbi:MAG: glucuronate isomerase [Pirellulaceae bacterium]
MTSELRQRLYQQLADIELIDPHTHINAHDPASHTLVDILGYHYYTELAHSAGMKREQIEDDSLSPKEKVGRLIEGIGPIDNTIQYSWLIDICQRFFDFDGDRIDASNWEALYDSSEAKMTNAQWREDVFEISNVKAVFLTNDFDDPLEGFDTDRFIPCLRTDDLVFHLGKREVVQRLEAATKVSISGWTELREAIGVLFEHFTTNKARACAISLPPNFAPEPVPDGRVATALDAVLKQGASADPSHSRTLSHRIFWTLAEMCDEYQLPFDLMIGVHRGVYPAGVYQGQDLYDSRVSLIQFKELFNAFPSVRFPISVLASVTNQELASYAWIFPNVVTNGHWWYSNTPSVIERDAAHRLEAVPRTKQIGYYSDAYKLEFVAPKFDMYRKILAKVLEEYYVVDRNWNEDRAVEFGRQVLRGNVESIFNIH